MFAKQIHACERVRSQAICSTRVPVGHRTPAILVVGDAVTGRAFPEAAAPVLEPRGERGFSALAILAFAPFDGAPFDGC